MSACDVEIASDGEFMDESRFLRAQMHLLLLPFGSATKQRLSNDLLELKNMHKASQNQALIFGTKLLMCRIQFSLQQYSKRHSTTSLYRTLASDPDAQRRGIVHFWCGYDQCATLESDELQHGLEELRISQKLLGEKFFAARFYQTIFSLMLPPNASELKPVDQYVLRMGKLHLRFPNEIQPIKLLINYYIRKKELGMAAHYLLVWRNALNVNEATDGTTNEPPAETTKFRLVAIIDYLKKAIRDDPDGYEAYDALIDIYLEQTFEYAKALEVMTRAMALTHDRRIYGLLFERRQSLLSRIAAAKFWPEL